MLLIWKEKLQTLSHHKHYHVITLSVKKKLRRTLHDNPRITNASHVIMLISLSVNVKFVALSWTSVDLSSVRSYNFHLRAPITKISLKITYLIFIQISEEPVSYEQSHLLEISMLSRMFMMVCVKFLDGSISSIASLRSSETSGHVISIISPLKAALPMYVSKAMHRLSCCLIMNMGFQSFHVEPLQTGIRH